MGTWAPTSSHPTFNGGTITTALRVDPTSDNTTALRIDLPSDAIGNQTDYLDLRNQNGTHTLEADASGNVFIDCRPSGAFHLTDSSGSIVLAAGGSNALILGITTSTVTIGGAVNISGPTIGFFGTTPAARPAAPVTLGDVIAALQTLGLVAT